MKQTLLLISNDLINLQNLISALIGGLLVIVGQVLMEILKIRKEKRKRIIELSGKAREIEQHLFNELRELAMFKTHVNYWWFCHLLGTSQAEYNKKEYEEHLRSQSEARQTEKSIGTRIAEYFGTINEYLTLVNKNTVGIVLNLERIKKISFRKANEYAVNLSYEKVKKELVEEHEKELKEDYWKSLKPISDINEVLYNEAKRRSKQYF